jgi:O-succinylbenzoic acid--CoA ligase
VDCIKYSNYFQSDNPFITEGKITLSYKEFWSRVQKVQLPKTKRVLLKDSGINLLVKYFATISSGRSAVLLDASAPQTYINETLSHIDDCSFIDHGHEEFSEVEVPLNQPSTMIFTSGSTGKPKAVVLSHMNMIYSARGTNEFYEINEKSHWAATLPFFHVGGMLIVFRTILAGAKTSILDPKNIHESIIEDKSITHLSLVSMQLQRILADENSIKRAIDLSGIILGGAKTPYSVLEQATNLGIKLSNSYGQTESCAQVLATPLTRDLSVLESVGRVLPYREIEILEDVITIKGKTVALGYYPDTSFNGVVKTQDLASVDKNGNYTIHGRADDVFISGGENINPHEINSQLLKIDGIKQAHTFKVSDDKYTHMAQAIIESNNLIDHSMVKEQLSTILPSFKIPKVIHLTHDISYFQKGIKLNKSLIEKTGEDLAFFNQRGLRTQLCGNYAGELLVIFHGFMGSRRDFYFMGEEINELKEKYLMAFVDLPHFGESKDHDFKDWQDFSNYLSQHLNRTQREINLLGYSMGGRVALELSFELNKLNKLILESAGPGLKTEEEKSKRLEQDKNLFKTIKTQDDLDRFIDKWYAMGIFTGIKDYKNYEQIKAKKIEDIADYQKGLVFFSVALQSDYRKSISQIATKTSFIFGHLDKKYSAFALELNDLGVDIIGEPEASHNVHSFNTSKYLSTLKSLLLK